MSTRGVKGGQGGWGVPKTAHFWQFFGETSIGSTKWLNLGQVRPNIISTHKNESPHTILTPLGPPLLPLFCYFGRFLRLRRSKLQTDGTVAFSISSLKF